METQPITITFTFTSGNSVNNNHFSEHEVWILKALLFLQSQVKTVEIMTFVPTRWSLKCDSYDRLVCLGVNVVVNHSFITQYWNNGFLEKPVFYQKNLQQWSPFPPLRFASLCLPPSPSAWLGGVGLWGGESPFSTLQVSKNQIQKSVIRWYWIVVLVTNSNGPITDKQLAYEAKERVRLQLERQEETLQRSLRRKPEKLDVMSLEPRNSF